MTIDQLIESYTYARVSGSTRSLTDLDNKTKDIIEGLNHKLKKNWMSFLPRMNMKHG